MSDRSMKLKVPKPKDAEISEERIKDRVSEVKEEMPEFYNYIERGNENREGQNLYSNPESYGQVTIIDSDLEEWLKNFRGVIGTELAEAVGILVFIDSLEQLDLACRLRIPND